MDESSLPPSRKPWGGRLTDDAVETFRGNTAETLGAILRKFTELTLLAAVIAVPMIYHLSLSRDRLLALRDLFAPLPLEGFFLHEVAPFFAGAMPVLETKFAAWLLLGFFTIATYLALRLYEVYTGLAVLPRPGTTAESAKASRHRILPLLCLMGFLALSLLSLLFWPPAVTQAAQPLALAPTDDSFLGAWATSLGGGGFTHSATAWAMVAFVSIYFLVIEDLFRERRLAYKVLTLLVLVSLVVAVMAVVQKVAGPLLDGIWVSFSPNNARNNLGSFIGHNTGLSSFLIAPVLVSGTVLVAVLPRRALVLRAGIMVALGVMALAMVLAQSRAVVPITLAMALVAVVLLVRYGGAPQWSRLYIALPVVVAVILASQLLPHRLNPLYRADVTLAERMGEFRTERLLTETRMRILFVSLYELLPDAPLLGHGFGSFQYVYPAAQGRFYQENPDTLLVPTSFRTFRAHNEYLQTWIETGLLGLAVALAGVFFLLRGGWRVLRRSLLAHHRALQVSILLSLAGLLLHALVDFPMRIPPLALTIVLLAAMWSAGDRLWLFPLLPPRDEDDAPAAPVARRPGVLLLPTGVGIALIALLAAGSAFAVSGAPFVSYFTRLSRGESYLFTYMQSNQWDALASAHADFTGARRIFWSGGAANRLHAQAELLRSRAFFDEADYFARQDEMEKAGRSRELAVAYAETALGDVNTALHEEHFHNLHLLRSETYLLLADNALGEQRTAWRERGIEELRTAVLMNPGDAAATWRLVTLLEDDDLSRHRPEVIGYLAQLARFHEEYFDRNVFSRVLDALSLMAYGEAHSQLELLAEAVPDEASYRLLLAATHLARGETDRAEQIAERALRESDLEEAEVDRDSARMILVRAAIREGRLDEAWELVRAGEFSRMPPGYLEALKTFLAPSGLEEGQWRRALERAGRQHPIAWQVAAQVAWELFGQRDDALAFMESRQAVADPPLDLQGYVLLARLQAEAGSWDAFEDTAAAIRDLRSPFYPRRLALEILAGLEAQRADTADGEGSS